MLWDCDNSIFVAPIPCSQLYIDWGEDGAFRLVQEMLSQHVLLADLVPRLLAK